MKKRGNIFLIEFIAVMPFLLAFFIYLQPYLLESYDESTNLKRFAEQSINILRSTEMNDLPQAVINDVPEEYLCLDCSVAKQILILMVNNNLTKAMNLSNSSFANLIPSRFKVGIQIFGGDIGNEGIEIYLRGNTPAESIMVHSTIVDYYDENPRTTDVYMLQVKVWT